MCGSKFSIQAGTHFQSTLASPAILFSLPECCEPCHLRDSCHNHSHSLSLHQFIFRPVCVVVDLLSLERML